jgi:hypothetical protein
MDDKLIQDGCRVIAKLYSGEVEMVILENEKIELTVLAGRGADLVSFIIKEKNLDIAWRTASGLPTKLVPKDHPADVESFVSGYPGGWQSIFPNGGAPSTYNGIAFSQHDEISMLAWDYEIIKDSHDQVSVRFTVRTQKTPFKIEKTYSLKSGENRCEVTEVVTNLSAENWQVMWGSHLVFGEPFLDEFSYIELPDGGIVIPHESEIDGGGRRLGNDEPFAWPIGLDGQGNAIDFAKLPTRKTKSEMLYIKNLTVGWYQLISPTKGIKVRVNWDKNLFPYLWFWQEFGASSSYPWFGKHYNIGLEPFSSFPTNGLAAAVQNGSAITFEGNETKTSRFSVEITAIK